MILKSFYKRLKNLCSHNKEREDAIKKRGVIIYTVYDNFSFHQFFVKTAESNIFEYIMMGIIIANTICCTYSAEYEVKHNGEDLDILNIFEIFFVSAYTVEFFIKIVAFPLRYWFNPWNIFDFIVLIISYLPYFGDLANLSFLRVVRAIRLMRLIRSFKDLNVLLGSLGKTFSSSLNLIVMLFIFMLIISITGLYLFGQGVPDPWGNLGSALLSIFAITTADAWAVYQDDLDEVFGEVSRFFSVFVILFLGIIFSSLVVASVTDGFSESAEAQRKKTSKELLKKNSKYSDKVKRDEYQKKTKQFAKAKEDAVHYSDLLNDSEIVSNLDNKGQIDPQKNIFENPQWMNSLKLILFELQKDNNRKKKLYNEMFRKILEMSDFTNSPQKKKDFQDQLKT